MFPKVLILGQPFNLNTGGGITINSLFRNWPAGQLFLLTTPNRYKKHSGGKCKEVFVIGKEDIRVRFPFSLFIKNNPGKTIYGDPVLSEAPKTILYGPRSLYNVLFYIVFSLGLNFIMFKNRRKLSPAVSDWIRKVNPDLIYTQLGHYEINKFVINVQKEMAHRFVIHIMDDWPRNSAKGILSSYWQRILEKDFLSIIEKSSLLLCISKGMAEEYKRRYHREFSFFHYAIDPGENPERFPRPAGSLTLFYPGRVGFSNQDTIREVLKYVVEYNQDKSSRFHLRFIIYTPDILRLRKFIRRNQNGIEINPSVPNTVIKQKIKDADILLLPLDSDLKSRLYINYSLPTKIWEFINAGKPILYIGPNSIYIASFIRETDCATSITDLSKDEFFAYINRFANDSDLESINKKIGNGFKLLRTQYNPEKMRSDFQNSLQQLVQ